jgi:hypothetical protein
MGDVIDLEKIRRRLRKIEQQEASPSKPTDEEEDRKRKLRNALSTIRSMSKIPYDNLLEDYKARYKSCLQYCVIGLLANAEAFVPLIKEREEVLGHDMTYPELSRFFQHFLEEDHDQTPGL